MKHKKLAAMAMSLFVLAGSYHVSAAGEGNTTIVEAACELPEIIVTVPTTGSVYLNPYQMKVDVDGEKVHDQIVSVPAFIQNQSEVPLSVDITVTGTISEGSNLILSTSSMKDIETTSKKAFIYFEIQPSATDNFSAVAWDSEYDPEKHIVVRPFSRLKKKAVTLGAAEKDGCYGAFRLTGDCVVSPRSPWTEADSINVQIAFTFHPLHIDTVI